MIKIWPTSWDNPVFQLELVRLRRKLWWPKRWFYVGCLAIYPLLLAGLGACGLIAAVVEQREIKTAAAVVGLLVAAVLGLLVWMLGLILPWAAPAITASAIARESELGTLDLLRGTLLSEGSIVLGKLGVCLLQLWPGIFLLILLTPFQVIKLAWGSLCLCPTTDLLLMMGAYDAGIGVIAASVLLVMFVGTLKPLGDLVFNAAVGMLVSVLARSTSLAIAVSYGVILAVRAFLYLTASILMPLLALALVEGLGGVSVGVSEAGPAAADPMAYWLLLPSAMPILGVLVEIAGAVVLVWVAVKVLAQK